MSLGLDNINALQAAVKGLTREQDEMVTSYLLGAVSNYVERDVWDRALGWAVEHVTATERTPRTSP